VPHDLVTDAALTLDELLERHAVRRAWGGPLAYERYGPPRAVQALDVLAHIPAMTIPAVVDDLAGLGWQLLEPEGGELAPRRLELEPVLAGLRGRAKGVLLIGDLVRVALLAPWHPFHWRVLDRAVELELGPRRLRFWSPEDLIVDLKIRDRPTDITAILALVLARKGTLDLERIRADARQLLTDESWTELDRLLAS
jgi:hypothetical protein